MTVIDGTSTTTPAFTVGQRVFVARTVSPTTGRDMGPLARAGSDYCEDAEIGTEGTVTYSTPTNVRVKFDDGSETRLVAAWRFDAVTTTEQTSGQDEPLAEWEIALLAPFDEVPTTTEPVDTEAVPAPQELAQGMRVTVSSEFSDEEGGPWVHPEAYIYRLNCCGVEGEHWVSASLTSTYYSVHIHERHLTPWVGESAATEPEPEASPEVNQEPEPELEVGMEVEIDPQTREMDSAWWLAAEMPTRGRITRTPDPGWASRCRVEALNGDFGREREQSVSMKFLTPAKPLETVEGVVASALPEEAKPWLPKLDEVVAVIPEEWERQNLHAYGMGTPQFVQVTKVSKTECEVIHLPGGGGTAPRPYMGHCGVPLSTFRQVAEGEEVPRPIKRKATVLRLRKGQGSIGMNGKLLHVTEFYTDGYFKLADAATGKSLGELRADRLEVLPPIPMEPGQLKAEDVRPGREYRLHPDARSAQGDEKAFRYLGSMPERVLASDMWYDETKQGIYVIHSDTGKGSWVELKWLVPLDHGDKCSLGGDEFFDRKGEVFAFEWTEKSSWSAELPKRPTRVQLTSDHRDVGSGLWSVKALDGYYRGHLGLVEPDSLKPLPAKTPEHVAEVEALKQKLAEEAKKVEAKNAEFENLLTEMFMVMDERATDNGLCNVWEKERDKAILAFFKEHGLNPVVMPRMGSGDVFLGVGMYMGRVAFFANPNGSYRDRDIIDQNGAKMSKKDFVEGLKKGYWKHVIACGEVIAEAKS